MTKTEAIIFWQKWVSPMRCASEKEKQDILDDMLNKADDEVKTDKVLVSPTVVFAPPREISGLALPNPARVVIKNVKINIPDAMAGSYIHYKTVDSEIHGDLYFEVEKK